jgi:hypothetical protein
MNGKKVGIGFLALVTLLSVRPIRPAVQGDLGVGLGLRLATPDRLRGVPLAFTPYAGDALPARVDLSPNMPPPGQQGEQNSCVGWAVAYALKSYQEKVDEGWTYNLPDGRLSAARVFSPSFIYNQCNHGQNVPILYMDAFNVLTEKGAALWVDMPYLAADFVTQPGPDVVRKASRYKIDFWRQVNVQDIKEVKSHLHAGYPVLIGANVDAAFIKQPAGQVWNTIGTAIGGHAMVVVGYDDAKQAFRLMNSWGSQWADNGFCWVDYDHFRKVVNEGYVAKDAHNGPAPTEPDQPNPKPDEPRPPITPPVRPAPGASLAIASVSHNATFPNEPNVFYMRFDGSLFIPAGLGRKDQIAVYFYYDNGNGKPGVAVPSNDTRFADVNGYAACGTQLYPIPVEGLRNTWIAWIPYSALAAPVGHWETTPQGNVYRQRETKLLAQAVLFVDNFGIVRSPFIPFLVRK